MNIIIHIKQNAPQVFVELSEFIGKYYQNYANNIEEISDYIALGIVLDYMNENAIETSLSDISKTTLEDEILSAIIAFEATTKHFS